MDCIYIDSITTARAVDLADLAFHIRIWLSRYSSSSCMCWQPVHPSPSPKNRYAALGGLVVTQPPSAPTIDL
jgi:hypothetical protein